MSRYPSTSSSFKRRFSALDEDAPAHLNSRMSVRTISTSSTLSSKQSLDKTVTVTFKVQALLPLGHTVALVGNSPELGNWSLERRKKLTTSAMTYPIWVSEPVSFRFEGDSIQIEYKFLDVAEASGAGTPVTCSWEKFHGNRKLSFCLQLVEAMKYEVECVFNCTSRHEVDSREGFSLLLSIETRSSIAERIQAIIAYITEKQKNTSLKDFLSVCFYFKNLGGTEPRLNEEEEGEVFGKMLELTTVLLSLMTEEIEPVLRRIIYYMSLCSVPLRMLMKGITTMRTVRRCQLDLGCESPMLLDLLDELFASSARVEQAIVRIIILNSIRRVLKTLRSKSRKPEYLLLYEVWIIELQESYIENQFLATDSTNVDQLLDQVSSISEFVELNHVCEREKKLAEELSTSECLESKRLLLIQMIDTANLWMAQYIHAALQLGKHDYINVRDLIIQIGSESVQLLYPVLSRALYALNKRIGKPFRIGLCTGTAVGKVMIVHDILEVPASYTSVIAVTLASKISASEIPANVTGIVRLGDSYICAQLVAQCLLHNVVLGVVSEEFPRDVELRTELRVQSDSVEFF